MFSLRAYANSERPGTDFQSKPGAEVTVSNISINSSSESETESEHRNFLGRNRKR